MQEAEEKGERKTVASGWRSKAPERQQIVVSRKVPEQPHANEVRPVGETASVATRIELGTIELNGGATTVPAAEPYVQALSGRPKARNGSRKRYQPRHGGVG